MRGRLGSVYLLCRPSGSKVAFLTASIVALWPGMPLLGDVVGDFARQVQGDVAVLSSEPTLAAWQTVHPSDRVEPAHYGTENDRYEVDFVRRNRWCAASFTGSQLETARTALFYVPAVARGSFPPLPVSENHAIVRECRMQALWYATKAGVSLDLLVKQLSSYWGKPNGQTATPDIEGSGSWKGTVAWHRGGMNIWVVYDAAGESRGAIGPCLIVYARRDIAGDPPELNVGSLSNPVKNQITDAAGRIAAKDSALTTAVLDRSQCREKPLKREPESRTLNRLAEWLKNVSDAPPARHAALLIVADAYVACAQLPSQALVPLGAKFATHCPQDGAAYDGNFLREAEKLDPTSPMAELAGLASLGEPCLLEGHEDWPDLVIKKGEKLLSRFPQDQWTPWIHYAVAGAHATKLSFAYPEGNPEGEIFALTPTAMQKERNAAIEHFEDFIRAKPAAPESIYAWQETWRLLAGLPPSQVGFGCGCE